MTPASDAEIEGWSTNKLRRKTDQAWDLAGCARQDGDRKDEDAWTDEARRLAAILGERRRYGL